MLALVLCTGAALRTLLVMGYRPAILNYPDTWGYVRAAAGPLFHADDVRPVGYALLLRAVHPVLPTIQLVIIAQHVAGIGCAVLSYAIVRRLGWPTWSALIPAAVVALSPDILYFEHSLLSETAFMGALLVATYAGVRSLGTSGDAKGIKSAVIWFVVTGLALGAAMVIRSSGIFAAGVMVVIFCLRRERLRIRAAQVGCVVAGAMTVIVPYATAHYASSGTFALSGGGGWALYARAAPFADCDRFNPPRRATVLCENTDPVDRYGGDFYSWQQDSPGRKAFGGPPSEDGTVGGFGRAAILGEPGAYLRAVARDLWRYVDVRAKAPPYSGSGPGALGLGIRDARVEQLNRSVAEPYFGQYDIQVSWPSRPVARLQPVLRVPGPLLLVCGLLLLAGLVTTRGRDRVAIAVIGLPALAVPFGSVALGIYGWRYAVPILPEYVAGGAIGAAALLRRARTGRRPIVAEDPSIGVDDHAEARTATTASSKPVE
ncbi:MAG TPA: phospholipid carrier-dependent glycosyltransferase [Acidimicrobiales bacterium]|nr:phospholipid carrier-dependent glycosyltransferase [Acidimicrobiales bacterium]